MRKGSHSSSSSGYYMTQEEELAGQRGRWTSTQPPQPSHAAAMPQPRSAATVDGAFGAKSVEWNQQMSRAQALLARSARMRHMEGQPQQGRPAGGGVARLPDTTTQRWQAQPHSLGAVPLRPPPPPAPATQAPAPPLPAPEPAPEPDDDDAQPPRPPPYPGPPADLAPAATAAKADATPPPSWEGPVLKQMKHTKGWKVRTLVFDAAAGQLQIHDASKADNAAAAGGAGWSGCKPRRVVTLEQLCGIQPQELLLRSQYDEFTIAATEKALPRGPPGGSGCARLPQRPPSTDHGRLALPLAVQGLCPSHC